MTTPSSEFRKWLLEKGWSPGEPLDAALAEELFEEVFERWIAPSLGPRLARSAIDHDRAERLDRLAAPAEAPGKTAFRLGLLGHPRTVRRDPGAGELELAWSLRRAFEIVAFLALAPEARAAKDELIEALWSDASAAAVRKNFHPTLSHARRTLGEGGELPADPILYARGVYRLNPAFEWWVDALELERLAARGRELEDGGELERAFETGLEAWRLYSGPLLLDEDAPWATGRREDLRREYLRVLRGVGRLGARLGRLTEALDAYRGVLLEEPFEERVHVSVMEIYARQGRRDLVRQQYVRLQDHLEELKVEPLAETQERYHELMLR